LPVLLAALLVALDRLLEAPLVSDASSELRLDEAEPVAVAREELSADDREARSELTDEETEETADETEEAALLADEARALLAEEPAEAAEEVTEETTLERELATELAASWVVVVWAEAREKAPMRTLAMVAKRMVAVCGFGEGGLDFYFGKVGARRSERFCGREKVPGGTVK